MQRAMLRPSVFLLLATLLIMSSCDGGGDPVGPIDIHEDVRFSLSPYGVALKVGESFTIVSTLTNAKGRAVNPRSLKWHSTAPAQATVDRDGVVTGVAAGEVFIIASSGSAADTTRVRVLADTPQRAGVAIVPDTVLLTWLDATALLTAAVYDGGGTQIGAPGLTWKSLSPGIAHVDNMGTITAKGAGVALIVATAACCNQADTAYAKVQQVVDSVSIDQRTVSLGLDATQALTPRAWDRGGSPIANATFSWTSDNPAVAKVASSGQVTAVSAGTTSIRAKSGSRAGASVVTVAGGGGTKPSDAAGGMAELPRVWVNTDWVEPTGKTIFVAAGGDLQGAINSAQRGDVIELQAGATYAGHFKLPPKSGSGWIVIRTRGSLPAPGTRVRPTNKAGLAKLVGLRGASERVLTVESGASHYRIVGLEITYPTTVTAANTILDMQNGSSHIIVDRSYVHGHSGLNLQRCVLMHAEHAAVIDSWLSECHYKGSDSQAIVAWNTNGPLKIVNNHLEGAGENVMFGGATPYANTIPSDIEIRRNHFFKPRAWLLPGGSSLWTVKNLFEIKFGQRILMEGNIFDGNWRDGQDGHAFNIKLSAREDGDRVQDITIRYNILRNSDHGIKISNPTTRIYLHDNLIYGISGRLFTLLGANDLRIENNTGVHDSNIITSTSGHERFVARGNIWGSTGGYGVKGGGAEGTATLDADFPGWVYESNGHIGRIASRYPSGNKFVADRGGVMFNADWSLRPGSPFSGLGADVARVLSMTAGVN